MAISRMNETSCVEALRKATETGNAKMVGDKFFPTSAYAMDICTRLKALGRSDLISAVGTNQITRSKPAALPQAHRRPKNMRGSRPFARDYNHR